MADPRIPMKLGSGGDFGADLALMLALLFVLAIFLGIV